MKTIVISDTHLTPHFEQKKFSYLEKIIKKSDQVIINGDFWDGYLCSFEEFTKSSWRKLFPLLKSKESVYLFGNHDPKKWATKKTNLFSKRQYSSLKISLNEFNLHIQHGNSIKPSIGERHPWVANKLTARLASTFLGVGVRCFGPDFYKKYYPRARLTDSKLRNWAQKNL
ncbi:MAG: metallophosphoesterase, partial [Patescibacteria group bacterium]